MNYLFKLALALIGATSFSITIAAIVMFILGWLVNIFKLNYGRDAYWVFNIAFGALILSWIIIFAYLMYVTPEKEKLTPKEPSASTKENSVKRKEPIEYLSIKANGTVESTHIGGRREVVPVVQVELTRYFHEENLWVLGSPNDGGIVQPKGRKNYFIPVLRGTLDTRGTIDTEHRAAQLFESSYLEDDDGVWSEFRVANIIFKDEKPVSLLFKHYNYESGVWKEIAGYEAFFTEVVVTERKKPKELPNISFEEHAKNCQQCGRPEITEDGPQSLCEEGFRIFQREIIQKMEKKK